MSDFKLIAIRPQKDCNPKFLKVLREGVIYQFYKDYTFTTKKNGEISNVSYSTQVPEDLFNVSRVDGSILPISISAIVGKNGSGKSSLVDLFYVAVYNISAIHKVLYNELEMRLLTKKDIVSGIKVEIFYQIKSDLYLLLLEEDKVKFWRFSNGDFNKRKAIKFNFDDFFYTIALNYSLHALNSLHLGNWVKNIFHKNDGYRTPVVLNPFRTEGSIDINKEEYLVRSRLIANVLGKINPKAKIEDSLRNIIENKIAYKLHVKINETKFHYDKKTQKPIFEFTEKYELAFMPLVFEFFLNDKNYSPRKTLLNRYTIEYILSKLQNISARYNAYKKFHHAFWEDEKVAREYFAMLSKDKSHVTFKLIQAINFLQNEIYTHRKEDFQLTISYLSKKLNERSFKTDKKLIDILPPAFFDIDIEFKDSGFFNSLSSGEKQKVYNISTLVYHLINLNSVNPNINTHKYPSVNIIFDELELYFHPDLQRTLVQDILTNIHRADLNEIDRINFIFITHSPFILSDIPIQNILFLTGNVGPENNLEIRNTFGANIHDLLSESFFLENSFIGELAKNRIDNMIKRLGENVKPNKLDEDTLLNEINLIGEPFLYEKLTEMYYAKYDKRKLIDELLEKIKLLEK